MIKPKKYFPFTKRPDVVSHLARMFFLEFGSVAKPFCLRSADELTSPCLAFSFSSRKFASKKLAQGLNRSPNLAPP